MVSWSSSWRLLWGTCNSSNFRSGREKQRWVGIELPTRTPLSFFLHFLSCHWSVRVWGERGRRWKGRLREESNSFRLSMNRGLILKGMCILTCTQSNSHTSLHTRTSLHTQHTHIWTCTQSILTHWPVCSTLSTTQTTLTYWLAHTVHSHMDLHTDYTHILTCTQYSMWYWVRGDCDGCVFPCMVLLPIQHISHTLTDSKLVSCSPRWLDLTSRYLTTWSLCHLHDIIVSSIVEVGSSWITLILSIPGAWAGGKV